MNAMRAIFFLAGIAIFIVGANGSPPLMVVGVGLVVLALVSGFVARSRTGRDTGSAPRDTGGDS